MAGLEGRTLGRYELRQIMGKGGMADVYRSYDTHFDREVAVKVFKREDEDLLRRFVREAHLMASLSNPHLMPVYDSGTSTLDGFNLYFIVMPLMDGGTLRARTRRSPLPLKEACRYIRDIADALDYMHRKGIIHRDIKSSNILLDAQGRCYLSDFGIARTTTDSTQMTSTGNVLGTVDYMAPELFETNQRANERSDFYSLGILLFEMVTGTLPFSAESQIAVVTMHVSKRPPLPRTLVPDIPLPVERVILRSLEKRPELRYATATELAEAFCQAITAPPVKSPLTTNPVWGQSAIELPAETRRNTQPAPTISAPSRTSPEYYTPGTTVHNSGYVAGNRPTRIYPTQPVPNREQPSPQVRTQTRIVTVLALLALLAVLGPIGYVIFTHSSSNPTNPGPTVTGPASTDLTATSLATGNSATQAAKVATATAVGGVTATAQANATGTTTVKNSTATAVAGATVTAQANAAATASVIHSATSGQPLYTDTLKNKDNPDTQVAQWDQNINSCAFQTDGYHVIARPGFLGASGLQGCREAGKSFQNFTATVDVVVKSGYAGGIFFRTATDGLGAYSGYLFEIDNNGKYKISRSGTFNTGDTPLQDWTAAPAIQTGNGVKNTLQLIVKDNTFLFYVNNTFLPTPITDATYNRPGTLALLAATDNQGANTDVLYTNLNVYATS